MIDTSGFSEDQVKAAEAIQSWVRGDLGKRDLTLGGYAGSGKTTILQRLWPLLKGNGAVAMAPTGKAGQVLRSKGVDATTIHRLIYKFKGIREDFIGNETPVFRDEGGWQTETGERPRLLVCDESSMVNTIQHKDVTERGVPCLWVGDHGQLFPVGGDPGIMRNPEIRLEKIHRQAEGNTIIEMAHRVRKGHVPTKNDTSNNVYVKHCTNNEEIVCTAIEQDVDQTLVPTNALRHNINLLFRKCLKKTGVLDIGDRLICTFNDYRYMVFNGQAFRVEELGRSNGKVVYVKLAEETVDGWNILDAWIPLQLSALANPDYRSKDKIEGTVLFDYGYAITPHKAQGSEYGNILIIDQHIPLFAMERWRYTAITRGKKYVTIMTR